MRLPFFNGANGRKRDQIMAVDLGSRTTKAVSLLRHGSGFTLNGFAMLEAPVYEKTLSRDLLCEHLKAVSQALQSPTKYACLTVGVNEAHVRHVDLPLMSIADMRQVLKLNPKAYFQQDLPGHIFDCHASARPQLDRPSPKTKDHNGSTKQRVLVAGARKQLVDDFVEAAKGAGLTTDCILPALLGPVNTYEKAMPDLFQKAAVAVVDIGFRNSSICIIKEGELILSRVLGFGGDRITNGLSEALNISYAEAEGIKVGMPGEVGTSLDALLQPLGRELRASMDFFEHQHDCPVTQVLVAGGSSASDFILQRLKQDLMVDCQVLSPAPFLSLQLPPQQTVEIEQVAPQLTVAVGAALAAL